MNSVLNSRYNAATESGFDSLLEKKIVIEEGIPIPSRLRKGRGPSQLMEAISSMRLMKDSFVYIAWRSSIYASAKRAGFKVLICPVEAGATGDTKRAYRIWKIGTCEKARSKRR
jgi:hypothetical protein